MNFARGLLMYLREYRTMFHIGVAYGLSESNVCRTIKFIEQALINHPSLHLPSKRALVKSDNTFEVVLIDVAETPIERPKKNNANILIMPFSSWSFRLHSPKNRYRPKNRSALQRHSMTKMPSILRKPFWLQYAHNLGSKSLAALV